MNSVLPPQPFGLKVNHPECQESVLGIGDIRPDGAEAFVQNNFEWRVASFTRGSHS
jgi:hypothetical protein